MKNTNELSNMQFTRGILQIENLNDYLVPMLDFPFGNMYDILLQMRLSLNEETSKSAKRKNPPTASLNSFLQFIVPALSHPFIMNYDEEPKSMPLSGQKLYPMPALGIPQLASNTIIDPITPDLLKQILGFWLDVVVSDPNEYFSEEELQQQRVLDCINRAKQAVLATDFEWKYPKLGDLWQNRHEYAVAKRALRSLLATQFILASQHNSVEIDGTQLEWRAAHESDSLIPVTQALRHPNGTYYAFTMGINLRDMPGRSEPLIYFMPRLRRYMSEGRVRTTKDAARVMIEYPSPLAQLIDAPKRFVTQVPIQIKYDKKHSYTGAVLPMLARLIGDTDAHKALVDVENLLTIPQDYLKPKYGIHDVGYHMIYDTGMGPEPDMEAGLPMAVIQTLYQAAEVCLQGWFRLESSNPLVSTITMESIKQDEALSLANLSIIKDTFNIWIGSKKLSKKRSDWPAKIQERFRIALEEKPLVVLLIADTENALVALEADVRGVLAILDGNVPCGFEIISIKTPQEFILPINRINEIAWRDNVKTIRSCLANLHDSRGNTIVWDESKSYVAIIQRPEQPPKEGVNQDNQKKSALRAALGSMKIRSQMLRPFSDDDEDGLHIRVSNPKQAERGRVLNTVSDALIRGTGMTYAPPSDHYEKLLGFEPELARQIVVEYWVRYKSHKPKTDFIAVVRQHPNGYIDVILPNTKDGQPEAPRSIHDTNWYLQTLFAKNRIEDRVYTIYDVLPDDRVFEFFQSQLYSRPAPALIVPQVGDWRSRRTKWFADDDFRRNQITINNRAWDVDDLNNVRMVKMLTDENFNMRYWLEGISGGNANIDGLLAVKDIVAKNPTMYSIDSRQEDLLQPEKKRLDSLYQRGRVIEFAALMMQKEDNLEQQYSWCMIPHLARIHAGWGMGSTIYPYPCHLVCSAIDDALWTVFDEKR